MTMLLEAEKTALLLIDVQDYVLDPMNHPPRPSFYDRIAHVVWPSLSKLLPTARDSGVEVCYTVMENLTRDGRDRSLDYKLSGFNIPKGSQGGQVSSRFSPQSDDIVWKKSSACLFHSTNFNYVMHNMGISTILCTGFLTDQCVEQTMKVGAALGYRMICIEDACATDTKERHASALQRISLSGEVASSQTVRSAFVS
ncbi:isochorismatase family cysteine hydrolase [Sulfitobacter dubius]|nr:isochorismatase family cysteine hydrolase [Sulfitobacter dubius]